MNEELEELEENEEALALVGADVARKLTKSLDKCNASNAENYRFYYQTVKAANLNVSTPPKIRKLNLVLGWGTAAVDTIMERVNLTGFYSPRAEDQEVVDTLNRIYRINSFETEQAQVNRDAGITGAAYISVGAGDTSKGEPEIMWRAEAPNQVFGSYDARSKLLTSVIKVVSNGDTMDAELFTNEFVFDLHKTKRSKDWVVHNIRENTLGRIPYVFVPNDADSQNPKGKTLISNSLKDITLSGMRTLLSAETIREYFANPLRSIAGLSRDQIMNEDGTQKTLLDLIAGNIIALPYNDTAGEQGVMPEIKDLSPSSPKDVLDQLEVYGKMAAREIGVPPSYMGFETVNPTNADAITESDKKQILKAKAIIPVLQRSYRQMAILTLEMLGYEDVDTDYIEAVFARPETPTPAADADRLSKMNAMGLFTQEFPDFVYKSLNMSDVEIMELKEWLRTQQGDNLITQLLQPQTTTEVVIDNG